MAVYAVFDVLDRMDCQYEQAMVGDIKAEAKVLGHTSEYAFAVTEQTINTSILHVSMLRPASGLSEEEKQLAVRYLADSVLQVIDEVQALEGGGRRDGKRIESIPAACRHEYPGGGKRGRGVPFIH